MPPRLPQPCLDWMKAIGIAVIVYGHVAHATTVPLTPPVYLKQFGVTLFVFVTGFTLARERRPAAAVVVARLFPVYLYGGLLAALLALAGLSTGAGAALSNVLPFLGGANVLLDHFPANPSTWYVGTYLHLLLLWALLLRSVRIRWWMVACAMAVEIAARAALMAFAGPYVAYMALTSWVTVFVLGLRQGARGEAARSTSALPYMALLLAGTAAWSRLVWSLGVIPTFPFMTVAGIDGAGGALAVSIGAALLYCTVTVLVFEITRRLPSVAVVRFAARNSLIVFLGHMPIFFALNPVLADAGVPYAMRVVILLAVCGPGLALVSEGICRLLPADTLRARLLARFGSGLGSAARGPVERLLTPRSTS
jgi:peptidoglycan/LPS O-acetylase OafA/YrhL